MGPSRLTQQLEWLEKHPGENPISDTRSSFYYLGRHIIGEVIARASLSCDHPLLPCTVEQMIEATFKEGWFVRSFYYQTLACLVHAEALSLAGDDLTIGNRYDEWVEKVFAHNTYLKKVEDADQRSATMHAEGRRKAIEQTIPEQIHPLLEGFPQVGVLVSNRNFAKRVRPGVKCIVEFGKRHFHFDSEVTGRRETVSASFYAPGEVVALGLQVTVCVAGLVLDVDRYRITKVMEGR